jgi:hypothetical protein
MTEHGPKGEIARTTADLVRAGAAATPLTGVLAELSKIPAARRERRWKFFLNELLLSWDLELEELWQAVFDERIAALLEHAQRVAETARSDDKVQVAAKIVASVLHGESSGERVETANVLLQLIQPLEAHHLEVFTVIGSPRPGEGQLAGQSVIGGWTMTDLQDRLAHIRDLVPVIVAALTSAGLIIDSGAASVTYGGLGRHQLGPTDAGAWLLAQLAAFESPPPPDGS